MTIIFSGFKSPCAQLSPNNERANTSNIFERVAICLGFDTHSSILLCKVLPSCHWHSTTSTKPYEEVGRGTENLDMHLFNVKYAYTIDGGEIGELEFENFNAADATLHINGTNIHPGYAKGKMINANTVAMEIDNMLPRSERPETTEGYEGFYHLTNMEGTVEKATVKYIIRDHDKAKFQQRKETMMDIAKTINDKYGPSTVDVEITDSYCNMREIVEPQYHIVEKAIQAMKDCGVEPKIRAIRGGTDGAWLSQKGIPCPNIFTGGHNFHSRYEYLPVESMEKAAEVIIRLITLYGQEAKK